MIFNRGWPHICCLAQRCAVFAEHLLQVYLPSSMTRNQINAEQNFAAFCQFKRRTKRSAGPESHLGIESLGKQIQTSVTFNNVVSVDSKFDFRGVRFAGGVTVAAYWQCLQA